jgi:hypothetical protein
MPSCSATEKRFGVAIGIMQMLRASDWVEVRSKEEILETLDAQGQLEGMPFMPQMFQYCGQRFRIYKCAHKTCDTISGDCVGRRLTNAIHLELRCDGRAYGSCQAACLIFWKQAWLKPVSSLAETREQSEMSNRGSCTEEDVWKATRAPDHQPGDETRYVCQATQVLHFTRPLPWWDMRQYLDDYRSGNVTLGRLFRGFVYVSYYYGTLAFSKRLGGPGRWLYDRIQALRGGLPFPRKRGTIPVGQLTPTSTLNLQPGELVRTKSYKQILATLDTTSRNRGLAFDAELVPYCGGVYRVRARVNNFIDEQTGKMKALKTPAIILDGVYCQSRYSNYRMGCPRSIYSWWRENWLERVSDGNSIPLSGGDHA